MTPKFPTYTAFVLIGIFIGMIIGGAVTKRAFTQSHQSCSFYPQ